MYNEENKAINFDLPKNQSNVIKVIGVGGGGSNAINYIAPFEPKNIIIHDSARPFFNPQIINEGIKQLKKYSCAFPVTKIVDTVKKIDDKNTLSTIDRSNLYFLDISLAAVLLPLADSPSQAMISFFCLFI